MRRWVFAFIAVIWSGAALAGEVTVAVASNFLTTAQKIGAAFAEETGHSVTLSNGSTGLLFAQISNGAPFDVFLSADQERPARLLADGRAIDVQSYAVGGLALISREPLAAEDAPAAFAGKTVALADPTVAPYGRAATRAMERLRLDTATFRPALLANVGQVASIFQTGNADFAFVAVAQLNRIDAPQVLLLDGIAPEIIQDAALLSDAEAARAFWDWLARPETAELIVADGYARP
ncbi:MAG: molybdate ABC transporter substrate-binding protein [Paracoccaceae bacterium]|nr:molybdate ABC transporter substrate-binding protein [Paracoccaceae bacterium]